MKDTRWFILLVLVGLALSGSARAHPVAQGARSRDSRQDRGPGARSSEEVIVADTFAGGDQPKANSLPEVWQRHGRYLLEHCRVFADERRLMGAVLKV